MALKKSELYSSLWQSCDEPRGGMDASQYKDYVLVLLFIKYVSDKYAGQPFSPITIPKGAGFADMAALKGRADIGDQINKKIIAPLANANKLSDMPDFNDANKLGGGKEMVDRLTNLIAIFENPALDFSKNRADGDDILGDAYEYLMRHFATESGKSKGQFYTPSEVSRIMARIIGIGTATVSNETTVQDPTCGSGSLLLKVGDEASHGRRGVRVTLYGQEKDSATAGLARMNMILHDNPTALIVQGNTLANPLFKDGDSLKTFDFVVANPPFSDKRWSTGLTPDADPYDRFKGYGTPPAKQGDYAYLLHKTKKTKTRPDLIVGRKKYQAELIPPALVIARYYAKDQAAIEALEARIATVQQQIEEIAEEHGGEGGLLEDARNDKDKLTKASVTARLKDINHGNAKPQLGAKVKQAELGLGAPGGAHGEDAEEIAILQAYLDLAEQESDTSAKLKAAQEHLMEKVFAKYGQLTVDDIKTLVVEDKWLSTLASAVQGELDRVSQTLTGRIRLLAERYATPLPQLTDEVEKLAARVDQHLKKMGCQS